MTSTRGFHPRRQVRVRNLTQRRRGCDAESWREVVTYDPALLQHVTEHRAYDALDDLMYAHSEKLLEWNWHVRLGEILTSTLGNFSVRTECRNGQKLETFVGWRR